jgi:N-acetylglucosaminyl-diphospho-decaprenol L-rhamnosyltransferase
VSLIAVTFRSRDLVTEAVESARRSADQAGLEIEVIVVDNASDDGSADEVARRFPEALLVRNDENVGFGRACNQGFERAGGDWWLLLNPDARMEPRALGTLVKFARAHPEAGALAPAMLGAGTDRAESAGMQPGIRAAIGHFLLVNRLLPGDRGGPWRGLQLHRRPGLGPRKVEWASGGALLLRPDAVRAVRGFDPSFFLYSEDVDLGRRLDEAGWQTWLVPEAHVEHAVAASSGGVTDRWFLALHDYHARHASQPRVFAFDLIAGVGLGLRAVAASFGAPSDPRQLHARRMKVAATTALGCVVGRRRRRRASAARDGQPY